MSPQAQLLQATGRPTFLRVHDVGTAFGPPNDQIDVEVVVQLDSRQTPLQSFGFQLRNDNNQPARQGMLDLLRDAFNQNLQVTIDFNIEAGRNNGIIIRVARTR